MQRTLALRPQWVQILARKDGVVTNNNGRAVINQVGPLSPALERLPYRFRPPAKHRRKQCTIKSTRECDTWTRIAGADDLIVEC